MFEKIFKVKMIYSKYVGIGRRALFRIRCPKGVRVRVSICKFIYINYNYINLLTSQAPLT